jgi:Tetratricopeptide repeat
MPEYLATVRGSDGRKSVENVEARSADEAVRFIRERGCELITLHTDDLTALFTQQRKREKHISARDYILMRSLPRGIGLFWVLTLKGYRSMLWPMIFVAIALVTLRSAGQPWGFWDWLCLSILAFPVIVGLVAGLKARFRFSKYLRMQDALWSGRWAETLDRSERLGSMARHLPPSSLALIRAQAMAGMGRLDEGLKLLKPFAGETSLPLWRYESMRAEVYQFANRRDLAIVQLEKALESAPDNIMLMLLLARDVLIQSQDTRRAREFLDRARIHAISDLLLPMVDLREGHILLEEGRPREALPFLEAALKVFRARQFMPMGYLPVEQTLLILARTHAALGDQEEARKLYGKARPRLVALRNPDVDHYDREIGLPV